MRRPPQQAKRDANEAEIVAALNGIGCEVECVSEGGAPDLRVGFREKIYLLEVKMPKGRLTPAQIAWHEKWGHYPNVHIVHSVDEALKAIGAT